MTSEFVFDSLPGSSELHPEIRMPRKQTMSKREVDKIKIGVNVRKSNRYIRLSLIRPEENTIYSDKPNYLDRSTRFEPEVYFLSK